MADFISILIPTRNRPLLARLCVETALENSDDDCEVVVADNCDEPLALPVHPRLRILPPEPKPLTMPDNWERALTAARGEWVMLLSDKYMLVPGGIAALREEMCHEDPVIYYVYGVLRQGLAPEAAATAEALAHAGGELSWMAPDPSWQGDSRSALRRIAASLGEYPIWAPMLYTAVVRHSLVEVARRRAGCFFFGPCPDIASALQLLTGSEHYRVTRLPAVMAQYPTQASGWSTGASAESGGDIGRSFLAQLPRDHVGLGRIVPMLMQLTFEEGQRRLPSLRDLTPDWRGLAARAARAIEALPPSARLRHHFRLAVHLARRSRSLGPLWSQVRAVGGVWAPRRLARVYLHARGSSADTSGGVLPGVARVSVGCRAEALGRLEEVLLSPAGQRASKHEASSHDVECAS